MSRRGTRRLSFSAFRKPIQHHSSGISFLASQTAAPHLHQHAAIQVSGRFQVHTVGRVFAGNLLRSIVLLWEGHPRARFEPVSPFYSKKGLRREAEIPLVIQMVPKGGHELPRGPPPPLGSEACSGDESIAEYDPLEDAANTFPCI